MNAAVATYVYCLVANPRKPTLAGVPAGLRGTGPVRLLDVSVAGPRAVKRWLAVADAPLAKYGETAIAIGLNDLDWVSRAAIAHEAVIESFIGATAVLPMKLFTIFSSDERAVLSIRGDGARIDRVLRRVARHHEWGVRVTLQRRPIPGNRRAGTKNARPAGGAGYLAQKKAQRDAVAEIAQRARDAAADLYEALAPLASEARQRGASELPAQGGALLLDAVFLLPAARETRFRRLVERRARAMAADGYHVALSGPWPPYGFVQG